MKFYIVKITDGEGAQRGVYRIMANTSETAEQRAQVSFKGEFGAEGKIENTEQVE